MVWYLSDLSIRGGGNWTKAQAPKGTILEKDIRSAVYGLNDMNERCGSHVDQPTYQRLEVQNTGMPNQEEIEG